MKYTKMASGVLAALITLFATLPAQSAVISMVYDQPITGNIDIDVNDDGVFDFSLEVIGSSTINQIILEAYSSSPSNEVSVEGPTGIESGYFRLYSPGEVIGPDVVDTYWNDGAETRTPFNSGTYLFGVSFQADGNSHYAWLQFDFAGGNQLTLTSGAWENVADQGIVAGAIPEPSVYVGGLLGSLLLAGSALRRRKQAA